jgi:hypothetical protein
MPAKTDHKKEVEAILEQKLSEDALQLIHFNQRVAISTRQESITTFRNVLFPTPNACFRNNALDVSGFGVTGNDGLSVFKLTSFICPNHEIYNHPVNVLATPFSTKPVFVTVIHSLINNGTDVEIRVFSWYANGNAAPNISFNWRCRIELPIIIL